ncbi:TetR/AcrR family transcriptional regulator [Micromonospora carbonacea]|uniref:TetR/AcrR family transcriptional regulator n=1 Tax=Micromonospora carbonacea TaxID=47853 RepID=UPI003D72860A
MLRAAREAFAAEGLAVPLDEIAGRAGVGTGTVYRHFPSKNALFEAVVADRLAQLFATVRGLADADDPGAAFFAVFREMVAATLFNRALCEALGSGEALRSMSTSRSAFRDALAGVLRRAQDAGAVRADIGPADVVALVLACVAADGAGQQDGPGRMTEMIAGVFQPGLTGNETPSSVTHRVLAERHGALLDEAPAQYGPGACETCGTTIVTARTGRPARYCSSRCRQKAHRRRGQAGTDPTR